MSAQTAIEVRGGVFAYGRRRVLDGVDLAVEAGTTTVLLGENGVGKTTLLRCLAGLLEPAAGTFRVLGLDPARDRRRLSERTGLVPDAPDAWAWMTAPDLLRFLAVHHPRWSAARAAELLSSLRVPVDRRFGEMSRGEATKAMLVATLAHEPEVLLLDEPFAGLDPLVHDDVLRAVVDALGAGPRTVIVSTHDLDVAARIGDHVAILSRGRIVRHVPLEQAAGEGATPRREALKDLFAAAVGEVVA